MDERAAEVTDETEEPENQENDENSPEHMFSFGLVSFASCAEPPVRLKIFKIRAAFHETPASPAETNKLLAARSRKD
jgi:hypothetical protein